MSNIITTTSNHGFSGGDTVVLFGLHPIGWRGFVYRILWHSKIFRIEAEMFKSITAIRQKYTITNVTQSTFEVICE